MKQSKQVKKAKEKDNYLKTTFLVPVVTSVIDAVIVCTGLYTYGLQSVPDVQLARFMVQAATVLMAVSPTFLMINAFLSHRHVKKYPQGSAFYKKAPMFLTLMVFGVQVLYMVTLTGA